MSHTSTSHTSTISRPALDGSKRSAATKPKRHLRNYLLDPRFQLKYAAMVVAVAMGVSAVLGTLAYRYSHGQTEALSVQIAMQPDLNPEVAGDLKGWAEAQDRRVLIAIVLGIVLLGFTVGLTTIIVTHRVVGPAYRLKRTMHELAEGALEVRLHTRPGDELGDVFGALQSLVDARRARRGEELAQLDAVLDALPDSREKEALRTLRATIKRDLG